MGGVLITLALCIPLIGWYAAGVVLAVFGATGLPMVLGSMWRQLGTVAKSKEELRKVLGGDDDAA